MASLVSSKGNATWLTLWSLIIGLITGLLGLLFNALLFKGALFLNQMMQDNRLLVLLLPLLGAGLMAFLYEWPYGFKSHPYGFGVAQVIAELEDLDHKILKWRHAWLHLAASAVTLLSGLTAGRFGPTVHFGASIGSSIGRILNFKEEDVRVLIGCGVSGTLAVVFGMPLFASVFVFEVLFRFRYKRQSVMNFAPILLSASSAYLVFDLTGLGSMIQVFRFTHIVYPFALNDQILTWLILLAFGMASGLLAAAYIRGIALAGAQFQRLKNKAYGLMLTATIVGAFNWLLPLNAVLHNNSLQLILDGQIPLSQVLLFLGLQLLGASLTLGSGFIGGNFFPGLAMGVSWGVIVSHITEGFGYSMMSLSQWGLLGAVSVLAGFLNAPITCMMFYLEASHSTLLILPAIFVASIASTFTQTLVHKDIFSATVQNIHNNK